MEASYRGFFVFVLLLCVLWPIGAAANTLKLANPSFEEGFAADDLPVGWPALFSVPRFGKEINLSDKHARSGTFSICITDDSATSSAGLRSAPIPAR